MIDLMKLERKEKMRKYIADIEISYPGGRVDLGQMKVVKRIESRVFECYFKWQIWLLCWICYIGKNWQILKITRV
jgi:hypothetical protein